MQQCTSTNTNYLCKWDGDSCVSHFYKCDEATSQLDCPCYWNKEYKCDSFQGCSNYDQYNCPSSQGCVFKVNQCQSEDYITCSDLTSQTCTGKEGMYTECAINNQNQCDSVSLFAECSDLNNFKIKCLENDCKYVNNECVKIECEDLSLEKCTTVNIDTDTKKLCEVKSQKCVEAENADQLNVDSCYSQILHTQYTSTNGNYKWVGSCVQCESLVYSIMLTYLSLLLVVQL